MINLSHSVNGEKEMRLRFLLVLISIFVQFNIDAQVEAALGIPSKNKSSEAVAETQVNLKLLTPRKTMETFLMAMEAVKKGEVLKIQDAIDTLDLTFIDQGSRRYIGKLAAENIINTIDRIAKVDLENIPNYQSGPIWYFRKQTINNKTKIYDVEIALYKTKEGWKFTPNTINTIEDYFRSVEKLDVVHGVTELRTWKNHFKEKFPSWTGESIFLIKNGQWLGLSLIFLLGSLIYYIIRFGTSVYSRNNVETKDRYKATLPFGLFGFALFFKYSVLILELDIEVLEILLRVNYIFMTITGVWGSLQIVDYVSYGFEKKALLSPNKFDDVLVPMLKKTAKVLVIAFGGLFVAHSLTFDVGNILAGLGIGGVAVALAAKDTISNLFGSVTVILDRPFNIGDYIVLDKTIEGTVEQVGFRSTRIRTPINSVVTMPNSVLANLAIDNYGMRNFRRFRTILQLEYSTDPKNLEAFLENLKYSIGLNPNIEKNEVPVQVYLHDLGESSINILVNIYFIADTAKVEFEERQKLLMEIMTIAKNNQVEFAFPTRTLFMKKES